MLTRIDLHFDDAKQATKFADNWNATHPEIDTNLSTADGLVVIWPNALFCAKHVAYLAVRIVKSLGEK